MPKDTSAPRIAVIVPTFNQRDRLTKFLSILSTSKNSNYELTVFVIDDGSTDGTENMLGQEFPSVQIVRGDGSLWWTGAIHKGVYAALAHDCDYILWFNDDDRPREGAIEKLLQSCQSTPRTIMAAAVVYASQPEKTYIGNLVNYLSFSPPALRNVKCEEFQKMQDLIPFDVFGGHGIMIPAELFHSHSGLLSPKLLPHYYGDYGFFLRAAQAGYSCCVVPGAIVDNDDRKDIFRNGERLLRLRDSATYLFSRRSGGNLRDRPLLALTHYPTPYNLIWPVIFFIRSIGSIVRAAYYGLSKGL